MANPRRSLVRLIILGALLLLYPAAALVLRGVMPLEMADVASSGVGNIRALWEPGPAETGQVHVTLENGSAYGFQIQSVTSQVVHGDATVWSESWELDYYQQQPVTIAPGTTWSRDFTVPFSAPLANHTWLLTVEVLTGATSSPQILQTGLDLNDPSHPLSTM